MTIVIDEEEADVSTKFVKDFLGMLFNAFLDANNINVFNNDGLQVRVKLEVEED